MDFRITPRDNVLSVDWRRSGLIVVIRVHSEDVDAVPEMCVQQFQILEFASMIRLKNVVTCEQMPSGHASIRLRSVYVRRICEQSRILRTGRLCCLCMGVEVHGSFRSLARPETGFTGYLSWQTHPREPASISEGRRQTPQQ